MKQETSRKAELKQSKLPFGSTSGRPSKSSSSASSKEDILISIKPIHMNNIVERKKDHEFRKYMISKTVQHMWLYVTVPDRTLRYIATISNGKKKGEVDQENGIGNADFNAGLKESIAAYEIKELYQLKEPLPLAELQKRYGVAAPQRYTYVPGKMMEDIVLEDQIRLF
ncbi:hypothetical protein AX14_002267 [Amanita brunnescens Koide BX004]|nr:hypothetical protein AX14_002267 [Amanita brunnescens Koide BX004]